MHIMKTEAKVNTNICLIELEVYGYYMSRNINSIKWFAHL